MAHKSPRSSKQELTLHSHLLKALHLHIPRRSVAIGRLRLTVLDSDRLCEGIATLESEAEYARASSPNSPDSIVRGFCGPTTIPYGTAAVSQIAQIDGSKTERISCLSCAIRAGLIFQAGIR